MGFLTTLTSDQLETLRGEDITGSPRFYSSVYLSLSTNLTVFSARVNQSSFASSFADVTYDTVTTGAYTDIELGMTVYLSQTNDKRSAYFIGRVRKTPTNAILYINETSVDITDNDYIFVCADHRVWDKLERDASGVHYKDYDLAYHPPLPVITGLQSAYAGLVSGTPEGLTIAFSASAYAVASGETISSYAYTFPSGTTVTAGNVNTANVTVRFDEAEDEYWCKLEVTDSDSNVGIFWFPVWAHGETYPPSTGFEGISINGDLDTGFNASVAGFDGINTLLDGTIVCIWSLDRYNDVRTTINTNILASGQFTRDSGGVESDDTFGVVIRSTEFEIVCAGGILSRITSPLLAILNTTNATVWDEIVTLTTWRGIVHLLQTHSTFLERYSLSFFSTSDDFRLKSLGTQNNSLLATINDLSDDINARLVFAPDGACSVVRDARYLDSGARAVLTTIADFDSRDALSIDIEYEQEDTTGRVEADGGSFNPSSDLVTPLLSLAPGYAQGIGASVAQLTQQILVAGSSVASAQTELNERTGNHYAYLNTRFRLSVAFPDGYYFLIPSVAQYYTWLITTAMNNRGFSFDGDTNWLLTAISYTYDNTIGSFTDVSGEFDIETVGQAGDTIEYPPQSEIPLAIPPIPPFNVYPTFPSLPSLTTPGGGLSLPVQDNTTQQPSTPTDGNTVLIWGQSGLRLWWCDDFKRTAINNWREVQPSLTDGEFIKHTVLGFGTRAYVLINDVTNVRSRVWTTSNVFVTAPDWSAGAWMSELWDMVKATSISNEIMIQIAPGTSSNVDIDFTDLTNVVFQIGSIDAVRGNPTPCAQNASGVNSATSPLDATGTSNGIATAVRIDLGSEVEIDSVSFQYLHDHSADNQLVTFVIYYDGSAVEISRSVVIVNNSKNTWHTRSVGTNVPDCRYVSVAVSRTSTPTVTGTCLIDNISIDVVGGGSGNVQTAFSDDNGATFETPEVVGTSTQTSIGFDPAKIGTQALCGRSGGVEINPDVTDTAESFALYGLSIPAGTVAKCIVLPRYQPNTATTNNANTVTPDYILASSVPSGSSETMWLVDNDGNDFNDITPNHGGDLGLAISPHCVTMPFTKGNKLACILLFDITRRLYTNNGTFGNWNDEQALGDNADYIRMRRGDTFTRELYFVDDVPYLSLDFGVTIQARSYPDDPDTNPCAGIEVYG